MTRIDDEKNKGVKTDRSSGILLYVTALPSPYGVGDLGPEAYRFVDFLKAAKQRYWQVLPLNPTDAVNGNSPYSSVSVFAGNPLMISPDYFSETGQLWNHPVCRWNALKKRKYRWWLERVDHNLKFYDLLRIDHFRGLVAYWEIPGQITPRVSEKLLEVTETYARC